MSVTLLLFSLPALEIGRPEDEAQLLYFIGCYKLEANNLLALRDRLEDDGVRGGPARARGGGD